MSCFKIWVNQPRHSSKSLKPSLVFTLTGSPPGFCGLDDFGCGFRTADQAASLPVLCYIRYRATHINIDALEPFFRHTDAHLTEVFRLVSPDMCYDGLFILCKSQTPAHSMVPLGVTIALCIRKLRKNTSGLAAILTTWRKTTSVTSSMGASIKKGRGKSRQKLFVISKTSL